MMHAHFHCRPEREARLLRFDPEVQDAGEPKRKVNPETPEDARLHRKVKGEAGQELRQLSKEDQKQQNKQQETPKDLLRSAEDRHEAAVARAEQASVQERSRADGAVRASNEAAAAARQDAKRDILKEVARKESPSEGDKKKGRTV